jgi:putative peptidoglycan lipid II flippase
MEKSVSQETPSAAPMHRVLQFATITGAGFVLGQLSGLVREMVVSAQFGLSAELDAYFIARQVPTLVNNIVAGSAIVAAVTPVFSRDLTLGRRDEFWRTASVISNWVLLITGGLTLIGMIGAPWVIASLAWLTGILGGTLAQSTQSIASTLLVIMMPTLFLSAGLNMLLAMLNSLDRFTAPALIFLALNVGIIAAVILLTPFIGVYSVALGFLIGVLLQVLIQVYELRSERPRYTLRLDWHHPAVRQVLVAFLPITALAITAQINSLVDGWMAAALAPGSVSALSYANTLLGVFYMVGISLGIAVFPSLSRMAALSDVESIARAVVSSLRLLIFILAPITFLLIAFGSPIIGFLLGRGRFDAGAVQMTAQALGAYAVGLIAIAAIYILQRAFFAMLTMRRPFSSAYLPPFSIRA